MNKQIKHTYGGMTKDISKTRFPNTSYFDAKNFRITATDSQSTYALTNEKGTVVQITFPDYIVNSTHLVVPESNYTRSIPYTVNDIPIGTHKDHKLVGSINVKDGIVFFTTGTIDSIWLYKFDNENYIDLLYARDLKFTQDNQITGISNYENEKIEKIYWVDGLNQLRHLNIRHSKDNGDYEDIIDIPTNTINTISKVSLTQPIIKDITTGGTHTAGVIQYSYSLYKLNSGRSVTSPLSEQVFLNNGSSGGGDVNQKVTSTPIVRIENIDPNYTNIIVYAIKYTSYGVLPEVSIIYDQVIPDNRNIEIFDDGNILSSVTIEEFLLYSQNITIPNNITSKDNRLFLANYKEKEFKVNLDVRAYSFNSYIPTNAVSRVYSDVESLNDLINTPVRLITPGNYPDDPNDTFDNINLDFDTYKYSLNNEVIDNTWLVPTIGGTNKYLTYEIVHTSTYNANNKYFKDNEIYRLGIEFYNEYGISTKPMWIADFKAPASNMEGLYNTLKFTWKSEFYTWLNSQNFDEYSKISGYKLLIADRTADDKTIITSGMISTMMFNMGSGIDVGVNGTSLPTIYHERAKKIAKMPSFLTRTMSNSADVQATNEVTPLQNSLDLFSLESPVNGFGGFAPFEAVTQSYTRLNFQDTKTLQLFSPDTVFNKPLNLTSDMQLRIKGLMRNTENKVWSQEVSVVGDTVNQDGKGDGISMQFAKNITTTYGSSTNLHDIGLISHPGGSDPNVYSRNLWYRRFGNYSDTLDINNDFFNIFKEISDFTLNLVTSSNTGTATIANDRSGLLIASTINTGSIVSSTSAILRTSFDLNINITNGIPDYAYKINVFGNTIYGTANQSNITIPINNISKNLPPGLNRDSISIYIKPLQGNTIEGTFNITGTLNGNSFISLEDATGTSNTTVYSISGNPTHFLYINNTPQQQTQIAYQNVIDQNIFDIFEKPIYMARGQSFTSYSGNSPLKITNTLNSFSGFSAQGVKTEWKEPGVYGRRIVSINSDAVGNITMVPLLFGDNLKCEQIYQFLEVQDTKLKDSIMYAEIIKPKEFIYLGGIYGGNSFEDKRRTKYVNIGDYNPINKNITNIDSPGDTFVQNFKFLRICRSDDRMINQGTYQMEEIVEFPVETTINLLNRNDDSFKPWDSKISYSFDEYHKYNNVYSQQNNLKITTNNDYQVKEVVSYETNVISSKLKISGEIIDNWLTFLPNESLYLDGKFGPITNLLFLNDEVYTLQDRAFSKLSINPRVQVQGNDGVSIELGSGTVLQDYQYISTDVGCKNKHGSIVTPYGIYFYDSNNKRINQFSGQLTPISETAGLHSFLYNKDLKDLDVDKPLKNKGLSLGYDYVNNDVYFTFLTNPETFTLRYTEKGNMFVNNNDYGTNHYCGLSNYFLGNLTDNKIHRFNKGKYNEYFGEHKPSKVTLLVNPEADLAITINNIMYKSEAYLNGVDQSEITLTHIRAYNEYQDSGQVELVNNRRGNIQRLFREWNAQVPRVEGKRERIRNPWTYLELTFDNPNNIEFILHDMIISYNI